jgi:DNA-binding MarR family transcriptional regulator
MKKDEITEGWQNLMQGVLAEQAAFFESEGLTPTASASLVEIDQIMQRIRRNIGKREVLHALLKSIDPQLESSHLDVIGVIMGGCGEPGAEVTVGMVAEQMKIDPSRASRIVAETVNMGYVRRVASQADSRRICLELTDTGRAFADDFHRRKWAMMARGMKTWTDEEITTFATLLERFADWAKRAREEEAQELLKKQTAPAK